VALTNVVNITKKLDRFEIVKLQLIIYCFLNNHVLNETELNCLALLGCRGRIRLNEFCTLAADSKLLGTPTAVNNCLARVEKSKLFLKEGAGKKFIFLNPELKIQTSGNILLNFKFVSVETDSLAADNKEHSGHAQPA
jgi:hypothetical protein